MSEGTGQRIKAGASIIKKLLTTGLWGVAAVVAFTQGEVLIGLLGVAYLAYLWLFGGRWLIY